MELYPKGVIHIGWRLNDSDTCSLMKSLHFREVPEEEGNTKALEEEKEKNWASIMEKQIQHIATDSHFRERNRLSRLPHFLLANTMLYPEQCFTSPWDLSVHLPRATILCEFTQSPEGNLRQCWTSSEFCTPGKQKLSRNYPSPLLCSWKQLTAKNHSSPCSLDKTHDDPL